MYTRVAASAAVILALATATSGCTKSFSATGFSATDLNKERAALMSVDSELSAVLKSKDLAKLASFYAPDASVHAPGMEAVNGQVAIERVLAGADCAVDVNTLADTQFEIFTNEVQVSASGDIGYTKGTYRSDRPDGSTQSGKYVTIWRKQGDGAWRIVEDIFNTDEPAA